MKKLKLKTDIIYCFWKELSREITLKSNEIDEKR